MTSSSTGMVASTAVAPTRTTSAEPGNSPRARTMSTPVTLPSTLPGR
jgi:hypothetical protein